MLIDFNWYRTFCDDCDSVYPPVIGGFMLSLIGKQNYLGMGISDDAIVFNLKLNGLILKFGIR